MKPSEWNRLREQLASLQHEIWAHWMQYLFSVSIHNPDGSITIPHDKVARWKRQASTPYESLPQGENESDKEQADKILALLEESIKE
jgi:hypothetical protein